MLLCKSPIVLAGRAFGCGQCMPCRFNKRRVWAHRIMLEAAQYEDNAFVTLSYSDESLPEGGNLRPIDVQLWLKRLRRGYPRRVRYFVVGEYGDQSARPHYHAALFNYPRCYFGMSRYSSTRLRCCAACDYVASTWPHGNVFVGSLEDSSSAYIAGYVTKKLTSAGDLRLEGRHPEFARMSLRPGIGGDFMHDVASSCIEYSLEDSPSSLRHGRSEKPLGRYLSGRLRKLLGKDEAVAPEVLEKIDAEMLPMRLEAKADNENPSLKSRVVSKNEGRVASFEAKQRIFARKRVL